MTFPSDTNHPPERGRALPLLLWLALTGFSVGVSATPLFEELPTDLGEASHPVGELVQSSDGSFFGVTESGGEHGKGTVFRWDTNANFTILHSFDGATGQYPVTGLALGADGNLYGTTVRGGEADQGTVFRITPSGDFASLHSFDERGGPRCRLVQGNDAHLYGASAEGALFRVSTNGDWSLLGTVDGNPRCGLVLAYDGNFYGVTQLGGDFDLGRVFRMSPEGDVATVFSFDGTRGESPEAALVQGPDDCLYGTTVSGGAWNSGTVFRCTLGGDLTTLVSFDGTNGVAPRGPLCAASDGNLYGTTSSIGGTGTVFKLSPQGVLVTLHRYSGYEFLWDGLMEALDGTLYGMVRQGSYEEHFYRLTGVNFPPALAKQPEGAIVRPGSAVDLQPEVLPTGVNYQWFFNGQQVEGTNRVHEALEAGNYQVAISNRFGAATSAVAKVTYWSSDWSEQESWFTVEGGEGNSYRLETSTNLASWWSVTNFVLIETRAILAIPTRAEAGGHFFRLVSE